MGTAMLDWFRAHDVVFAAVSAVSLLTFVGSLVAIPWLVVRIPADYFQSRRHLLADPLAKRHPIVRAALLLLKNIAGATLVAVGIALLVLPGQGILMILVGLILMDFPGKFAMEQWLARKPSVLNAMNWLRKRANRPPIQPPLAEPSRRESP